MVGDVDLKRTFQLINLTTKMISMTRQAWNPELEKSALNSKVTQEQRTALKMFQLSSEMNGRLINLYA